MQSFGVVIIDRFFDHSFELLFVIHTGMNTATSQLFIFSKIRHFMGRVISR